MRQTIYVIGTSVLQKLRRNDCSFLAVDYTLFTTTIIYHSIQYPDPEYVSTVTFSADEMEQFFGYIHANQILNGIGFNDSSAIYYAAKRHCPMIVNDKVTIKACTELGVEYVELTDLLTLKNRQTMAG